MTPEQTAKYVRSKNTGPFWMTIDIFCDDDDSYHKVKDSGNLTAEKLKLVDPAAKSKDGEKPVVSGDKAQSVADGKDKPEQPIAADKDKAGEKPAEAVKDAGTVEKDGKSTEYESAFAEDLEKQDDLGNTVDYRVNRYNPMYYLCDYYAGAGSSGVAKYFRIRAGINQGDTALCTEVDLALALAAYGSKVDFETVWGQGHTEAERTGESTDNFSAWVNECLVQQ